MIKSFKHKGLEKLFLCGNTAKINQKHVTRLLLILAVIHKAKVVEDINFIGSNLHELKGERKGIWSVTVRANWRITFIFTDGNAYILNYEDYH